MNVREEVYEQILAILKDAKFPINTLEELIAALPEGLEPHVGSGMLRSLQQRQEA